MKCFPRPFCVNIVARMRKQGKDARLFLVNNYGSIIGHRRRPRRIKRTLQAPEQLGVRLLCSPNPELIRDRTEEERMLQKALFQLRHREVFFFFGFCQIQILHLKGWLWIYFPRRNDPRSCPGYDPRATRRPKFPWSWRCVSLV